MNISTLQSNLDFIKSLYLNKEWKDEDCKKEILEAIEECNQKIEKAFGWSMHKLYKQKQSIEAVKKVAKKFPSTLSYVDKDDGRIPIQSAACSSGFEYVPVLAKEGMKHKVGGKDGRGGLLMIDPGDDYEMNTLQCLSNYYVEDDAEDQDAERVNVFKELRRSGLFFKQDIQEYNLLQLTCNRFTKERFEYLVNWDPDALLIEATRVDDEPLIHYMADQEDSIHLLLKAGFKYHAEIGGLLFIKDNNGTLAFDKICNELGETKTMEILHDILSPTRDYPILHHVFLKAPKHKELFAEKFPWAYHLKDHNGRALHQAMLAAGPEVMKDHRLLFASLTDNQIQTKDPVTTLYPFAAMAVGENVDLDKCFYLLRRQPSVLERRSRAEGSCRRKKRKLDTDSRSAQK